MKRVKVDGGEICRTCGAKMQRCEHPSGWVPKKGRAYYTYWDLCPCGRIQNYISAYVKVASDNANIRPSKDEITAEMNRTLKEARKARKRAAVKSNKYLNREKERSAPSKEDKGKFYASWEWRTMRMKIITSQGNICQCCGSKPGDRTIGGGATRIVVDHIKPLSKFWHLRLEEGNLQVLCDECNQGKGAWDETDHRRG